MGERATLRPLRGVNARVSTRGGGTSADNGCVNVCGERERLCVCVCVMCVCVCVCVMCVCVLCVCSCV